MAAGTFGSVYPAWYENEERNVVIKKSKQRFLKKAGILNTVMGGSQKCMHLTLVLSDQTKNDSSLEYFVHFQYRIVFLLMIVETGISLTNGDFQLSKRADRSALTKVRWITLHYVSKFPQPHGKYYHGYFMPWRRTFSNGEPFGGGEWLPFLRSFWLAIYDTMKKACKREQPFVCPWGRKDCMTSPKDVCIGDYWCNGSCVISG